MVEEVFGAQLPVEPVERSRVIDVLVVATDVYSWKLLRRDRMLFLAAAVLAKSRAHGSRE